MKDSPGKKGVDVEQLDETNERLQNTVEELRENTNQLKKFRESRKHQARTEQNLTLALLLLAVVQSGLALANTEYVKEAGELGVALIAIFAIFFVGILIAQNAWRVYNKE